MASFSQHCREILIWGWEELLAIFPYGPFILGSPLVPFTLRLVLGSLIK